MIKFLSFSTLSLLFRWMNEARDRERGGRGGPEQAIIYPINWIKRAREGGTERERVRWLDGWSQRTNAKLQSGQDLVLWLVWFHRLDIYLTRQSVGWSVGRFELFIFWRWRRRRRRWRKQQQQCNDDDENMNNFYSLLPTHRPVGHPASRPAYKIKSD